MHVIRDTIARNLRRARQARELSHEQLSFLVNVDRPDVGSLERREYNPTVEMLEKLAPPLGIEVIGSSRRSPAHERRMLRPSEARIGNRPRDDGEASRFAVLFGFAPPFSDEGYRHRTTCPCRVSGDR
ncbi:helix-turn-helix transcriptional regulator [Rhizobium sp. 1399]|uniref:helix-turn-helix transcriptional regulator n=1 Tax=Rhizobium sp. 1399 TaxID=2817758 RepID=UPI00286A1B6B|nr:helix-turn-helix transcriptional regulator [Rhizobium sp. 1399]